VFLGFFEAKASTYLDHKLRCLMCNVNPAPTLFAELENK